MAYATRVEALRRRFGQETDTSIALQELAGLRRGKNQSAKELADSTRRLASQAYHSNDYASQEKAALHAFQMAVGEDLQLKCAERSCRIPPRVLRGITWSECLVYLDDILVFGPDFGMTLARLESVLDRLGEAGLKLKAKKCLLFQEEILFLGYIASAVGIGADPAKFQQVRDWPVPRDLHEV